MLERNELRAIAIRTNVTCYTCSTHTRGGNTAINLYRGRGRANLFVCAFYIMNKLVHSLDDTTGSTIYCEKINLCYMLIIIIFVSTAVKLVKMQTLIINNTLIKCFS